MSTEAVREVDVTFTVNGETVSCRAHPMKRLLDVLREDLNLIGTKEGCGEGECGACTVLVDGEPALSCMMPFCQAEGVEVTTVEGLSSDGELHPMQRAFHEEGGAQCGICTPGMVVSAVYYLENPDAAKNIGEALAGNQCRCTGYTRIFEAVKTAFQRVKGETPEV